MICFSLLNYGFYNCYMLFLQDFFSFLAKKAELHLNPGNIKILILPRTSLVWSETYPQRLFV